MAETLPLIDKITSNSSMKQLNRNLEVSFGDGYIQTAKDGLNSEVDQWSIQIAPLEGANLTIFLDFLAIVGTTEWFTWTPLGETVVKKWRIEKDSIQKKLINTSKFLYTFKMVQVFDLG